MPERNMLFADILVCMSHNFLLFFFIAKNNCKKKFYFWTAHLFISEVVILSF